MTYIVLIGLYRDRQLKIGKLGKIEFKKGIYFYVGSAKRNFRARIERHLAQKKKIFWHIDYLLSSNDAKIRQVWLTDKDQECKTAQFFDKKGYSSINRFGSSDCSCSSHLFSVNKGLRNIQGLFKKKGFIEYADKNYRRRLN